MKRDESTDEPVQAPDAPGDQESAPLVLGVLPELIGRQLRMAQWRAFKDYSMEVEGTSLTPGSFETLELLDHNPGLGQTRLAAAIGLDKSSIVPMVSRLESLKLVARKPSRVDKRAHELHITAKGRRTLAALHAYVRERDARITQGMTPDEIETLNRLLKRIVQMKV